MDQSVENCLSLSGVEKLIQLPVGCAEQTMVKMAPAVYAIEYLDASEQWVNFNPERKQEAISMIGKGKQKKQNKANHPEAKGRDPCRPLALHTGCSCLLKECPLSYHSFTEMPLAVCRADMRHEGQNM